MQLSFLSNLVQIGVTFIPRVFIAALIFTIGWWVARLSSNAVRKALIKEGIPRSSLIGRYIWLGMILFTSAMALFEIGIAKEVVIIGFCVSAISLGVVAIMVIWPMRCEVFKATNEKIGNADSE